MNEDKIISARLFRLMLFSLQVQAVFSAVALGLIGLGALLWHDRTALFFVLVACMSMIGCGFVQQRATERLLWDDIKPAKASKYAALALWYLSFALGFLAFAILN